MFAGYYDRSGGEDTGITAVAGFVADVRNWEEFDYSWRLVLAKYDVAYFHMRELVAFRGPFAKWRGERTKQANFLRELIAVIHETADFWLSLSVRNVMFGEAAKTYPSFKRIFANPYVLAARVCIGEAHRIMRQRHGSAGLKHVFEDGDQGKGRLIDMIEFLNRKAREIQERGIRDDRIYPFPIPIPLFQSARDRPRRRGVLPLQAADLPAWEAHRVHATAMPGSIIYRRPLRELRERIPGRGAVLSLPNLLEMCEALGLEKDKTP